MTWCRDNYLQLNTSKTKKMIFDFRIKQSQQPGIPVSIDDCDIGIVQSCKYIGAVMDNKLAWVDQCKAFVAKGH